MEEHSFLDASAVYTKYVDPRREEWATEILPRLRLVSVRHICEDTNISRAQMQRYRNKGAKPRDAHLKAIREFLYRNRRANELSYEKMTALSSSYIFIP